MNTKKYKRKDKLTITIRLLWLLSCLLCIAICSIGLLLLSHSAYSKVLFIRDLCQNTLILPTGQITYSIIRFSDHTCQPIFIFSPTIPNTTIIQWKNELFTTSPAAIHPTLLWYNFLSFKKSSIIVDNTIMHGSVQFAAKTDTHLVISVTYTSESNEFTSFFDLTESPDNNMHIQKIFTVPNDATIQAFGNQLYLTTHNDGPCATTTYTRFNEQRKSRGNSLPVFSSCLPGLQELSDSIPGYLLAATTISSDPHQSIGDANNSSYLLYTSLRKISLHTPKTLIEVLSPAQMPTHITSVYFDPQDKTIYLAGDVLYQYSLLVRKLSTVISLSNPFSNRYIIQSSRGTQLCMSAVSQDINQKHALKYFLVNLSTKSIKTILTPCMRSYEQSSSSLISNFSHLQLPGDLALVISK